MDPHHYRQAEVALVKIAGVVQRHENFDLSDLTPLASRHRRCPSRK